MAKICKNAYQFKKQFIITIISFNDGPGKYYRYDNHREQLLRGAGSSYNDDSLDVYPYFSPSCYKGFGDNPQGFYGVYSEVTIKPYIFDT